MEMAELVARSWWEQDGHFEHDWEAQHRSPGCVYFITLSLAAPGRALEQWSGHEWNFYSLKNSAV